MLQLNLPLLLSLRLEWTLRLWARSERWPFRREKKWWTHSRPWEFHPFLLKFLLISLLLNRIAPLLSTSTFQICPIATNILNSHFLPVTLWPANLPFNHLVSMAIFPNLPFSKYMVILVLSQLLLILGSFQHLSSHTFNKLLSSLSQFLSSRALRKLMVRMQFWLHLACRLSLC